MVLTAPFPWWSGSIYMTFSITCPMSEHRRKSLKVYTESDLLREKVALLDLILAGTCPGEITQDGRAFINRLKIKYQNSLNNETRDTGNQAES